MKKLPVMKKSIIFLLIVWIAGGLSLHAQIEPPHISKGQTVVVTLLDGSEISGQFVSEDATSVVVITEAMGKVTIARSKIKEIKVVSGENIRKGKVWFENPNPYKYLLGNSAIPKPKKTATYQNVWIFFNSFSYAPTHFLDITGGFEIFSLLSASKDAPYFFYLNPKASTKVTKNFYVGGNVLYINSFVHPEKNEFRGLGTLNAFSTYGNSNMNVTASVGWGFLNSNFEAKPLLTLSGMVRASRRIAFVSENWFLPDLGENSLGYYGIFSYGIRFLSPKVSIDLAFLNNADIAEGIPIGFPFLDFMVTF